MLAVGAGPAAAITGAEVLAIPKHLRESWAERVAMMVADGGLACEEAERLALAGPQAQRREARVAEARQAAQAGIE